MPLTVSELASIQSENPRLYEALTKIVNEINLIGSQTGTSGTPLAAPPNIAGIAVTAANGFFTIVINDPAGAAQPNLGIHYFLEWDTNPAFPNPTVEDIGPSRGEYIQLGNITTYWRAYSQFRNSPLSKKVVFGSTGANGVVTPTAVTGGGAAGGTPAGGGSGSGGGGGGFGGGVSRQSGGRQTSIF